jgi:uncharacterized protein
MTRHPNLELIDKFFEAYGKRDLNGLRQVLAEDAKWVFPGRHPLSGTRTGIDEVVALFDTLGEIMGKSNIQVEKLVMGVNDDYVVEGQHIWTNREDGNNLDHQWCVLWKFEKGKIVEGRHLAADQHAVDKFFTSISGVLLRDVTETDLSVFFQHQLDPEATRMAAFPARDRVRFMAHWTKILADKTTLKKTILFEGQVAGNIVCFQQDGQPNIGCWLGRDYWGKGIATQALSQFLEQVKSRPLYAHVAKHNLGSLRVLEKCGFTISGEEEGFLDEGGEVVEEVILKLG